MTAGEAHGGAPRPGRGAPPTLHDVAREAGVSLATASRALNGSTRNVKGENRERVRAAADKLGYTTNILAQATVRGTSSVIALLVADIADPYFGLIASGVARGADEQGLIVTIAVTERDAGRELRLIRALRGQRPQGLIVAASRGGEDEALRDELAAFADLGGRAVTFGGSIAGERVVQIDNVAGARMLGAAMAERGYRRAIVLAAEEGIRTSDDRIAGFAEGFGAVERIHRHGFARESGVQGMTEALAQGVEPGTLVFAMSDVVAIGAMSAIRAAGREVGSDIAVCGFDDVPASVDVSPALTTVRVPLIDVGYQAFRATVDEEWVQGALPLEVVVRESTP
ncbi:LacI family DNA-binding transcriptional regulator [Microbacterium sp. NPDC055903]